VPQVPNPLDGFSRLTPLGVWRRIVLTYQYHGPGTLLFRAATLPLRFTPLRRYVMPPRGGGNVERRRAKAWYRRHGRPVTIVIPSYRDAELVERAVASIRRTTNRALTQIVVADDASGPEHVARLRAIDGIEVVVGEENGGFARNVNRGLRAAAPGNDVVLMNSDVEALPDWLAALQYAVDRGEEVGIAAPMLLYPDGRIQFAGTQRNPTAPEWFDHRYRFRAADYGPARVPAAVLAATGACMYIRRAVLDQVGDLDERYAMAFEDVDYSLRAWIAGWRVLYCPSACVIHHEASTRGTAVGERERASQRAFWKRWGTFFDARPVGASQGALRVVYVTEDTGVGGGHRDIFEHLNRLAARGHEVALFTLGSEPDWFDLRVPVRGFEDYTELVAALAPLEALKIATWWNTATPVWVASVVSGIPVYFVQDIETSYYPDAPYVRDSVLASYRNEFAYMTISNWNRERLAELGQTAALIPPGIDLGTFHERSEIIRREDMLLAVGRSHPLKNLPLTLEAWRGLSGPRPELRMFGIEPELATEAGIVYETSPSDQRVGELMCEAAVFVQTSTHEGFCLPALEAMACGAAVVCTDAHGNRDFCVDGHNCLVPDANPDSVRGAIERLFGDPGLRERLGRAGVATAAEYAWELRIDELERFLWQVAAPRRLDLETIAVPEVRKAAR
jgi:GT2 family glycosyltransferase